MGYEQPLAYVPGENAKDHIEKPCCRARKNEDESQPAQNLIVLIPTRMNVLFRERAVAASNRRAQGGKR